MIQLFTVAMWLAFGAMAAYVAKSRGKNPYLWFALGTLLGLIGVFFIFFMPKAKAAPVAEQPKEPTLNVPAESASLFWYYLTPENEQRGPMSFDALTQTWREQRITPETYVWNETLKDWVPLSNYLLPQ